MPFPTPKTEGMAEVYKIIAVTANFMSQVSTTAETILEDFQRYFVNFQALTARAQHLFEQAEWTEIHRESLNRLDLYKQCVLKTVATLEEQAGAAISETGFWKKARSDYSRLLPDTENAELAETYFNSTYCCIFDHRDINDQCMFISSSIAKKSALDEICIQSFTLGSKITALISEILDFASFNIPFEDKHRDIKNIGAQVHEKVIPQLRNRRNVMVEVLKPLFFRNKGAYMVGRILYADGHIPFVLPILNNEQGAVYVDTVIFDPDDVSIIFSFTRSYFMVDAPVPSQIIDFLKTLLPHKELSELYNSIGHNKHGKTEFYASFVNHLQHSDDLFVLAPGIKGMVMSVFTLPSYDIVFKVIKDRFDPPKEMSQAVVREKYRQVSRHDRVGRMADTQEYSYFSFPRQRFSQELLDELQKVAPSLLQFTDDEIIVKHLYTERRMTPLNLYLQTANEEQTEAVMDEYGNAIKQIASANIFPGDMLLKNFGVTRHGRVVFYDYDEICFLHECNFRKIPEPKTEEQAMSSSPWYSVGPNDIFPEEFRLFFTGNPTARKMFEKHHQDLYTIEFWQGLQENIATGNMADMFPYRRYKRFQRSL